jgi:DNA-binding response OmpR family regulator
MSTVITKPRVLVVEDSRGHQQFDVDLRREGYEVCVESSDGAIPELAEQFRPDLAILEVALPLDADCRALARRLRDASDLPLLFVTDSQCVQARVDAFRAGADDVVVKPYSMDELLARAEALLRRSGGRSPVCRVGDVVIDEGRRTVERAANPVSLTRTEYELLSALARHRHQVLSKSQLLNQVWEFDAYDANLVEVHVSALRRKLERHGPRLIHTVRGVGYVLRA